MQKLTAKAKIHNKNKDSQQQKNTNNKQKLTEK